MIEQHDSSPVQAQVTSEQLQSPEDMTHAERIRHTQFLAQEIVRKRTESIARIMNTRQAAA